MPAVDIIEILRPSLQPCPALTSTCANAVTWDAARGLVPRGWLGAIGAVDDVKLVLVTAEPGDPADGTDYGGMDCGRLLGELHRFAIDALARDILRREGRPAPFHRNLRVILDLCWPDLRLHEQLVRTWITPAVLCSARVSGGAVPRSVESACATRYLSRELQAFPRAFVVALGGKAAARLRLAGRPADICVQHPSARHKPHREASWRSAGEAFLTWLARPP